jgi:CRP-like cAMP-binding protein
MPPTPSISNRLLAALAPEDFDALRAHLEPVPLPHKQTLSNPGAPIEHVYFVEQGMVSLVQPLEGKGGMIEVGMIDNEGFVRVPVLLGADTSPLEAIDGPDSWFCSTDASRSVPRGNGSQHRPPRRPAALCRGTPGSGLVFSGMQRTTPLTGAPGPLVAGGT